MPSLTHISHTGFSEQQVTGDVQVSMEVCDGKLKLTVIRAKNLKWRSSDKPVGEWSNVLSTYFNYTFTIKPIFIFRGSRKLCFCFVFVPKTYVSLHY